MAAGGGTYPAELTQMTQQERIVAVSVLQHQRWRRSIGI
jgi:hypothetical protein